MRDPRDEPERGADLPERQEDVRARRVPPRRPDRRPHRQGHAEAGRRTSCVLKMLPEQPDGGLGAGVVVPAARVRRHRRPAPAQADGHRERQTRSVIPLGFIPEAHDRRRRRSDSFLSSAVPLALTLALAASARADWSQFKGPNASGVSRREEPAAGVGQGQGQKWKAPLPARGVSSPVVVGDRVYVTCSSGIRDDRLHVLCFDAAHRQAALAPAAPGHRRHRVPPEVVHGRPHARRRRDRRVRPVRHRRPRRVRRRRHAPLVPLARRRLPDHHQPGRHGRRRRCW